MPPNARRVRPARKPNSRRRIASKTLNCSPSTACVAGSSAFPPSFHVGAKVGKSRASASTSSARRDGERDETRRRFFVRQSPRASTSLEPSVSSRRSICASPSSARSGDVAQVLDDALGPAVGASLPKSAGDAGEVSELDDGELGRIRKASARLVWRYTDGRFGRELEGALVRSVANRLGVLVVSAMVAQLQIDGSGALQTASAYGEVCERDDESKGARTRRRRARRREAVQAGRVLACTRCCSQELLQRCKSRVGDVREREEKSRGEGDGRCGLQARECKCRGMVASAVDTVQYSKTRNEGAQPRMPILVMCDSSIVHNSLLPLKTAETTLDRPTAWRSCRFRLDEDCAARTLRRSHSLGEGCEGQCCPNAVRSAGANSLDTHLVVREGKDGVALRSAEVAAHVGRSEGTRSRAVRAEVVAEGENGL